MIISQNTKKVNHIGVKGEVCYTINMSEIHYRGPVVLVVLDGVGLRDDSTGNAVKQARLTTLHRLLRQYPCAKLGASGKYVGVPAGDVGNSEVGHNAMGAGEIVLQRSAAVAEAIQSGAAFQSQSWQDIVARLTANHGTLHLMGIFSDGNVHSNISHFEAALKQAKGAGIEHVRIHALIDGRDVPPQSEPKYIQRIEAFIHELGDPDYRIASGGGRMVITADRYESDWSMVEKGWRTHVWGEGRQFGSATEAIETYRREQPNLQDQYLPPFVIAENGAPIGRMQDGDACLYLDFRADRAIEMAMAFTYHDFPYFDRGQRPDVYFAGMTEYNEDLHVPEHTLVAPPRFQHNLTQFLSDRGVSQFVISETVKFGHITYYFKGNSQVALPGEETAEIPSYTEAFNTRPWMKTAEITDRLLAALESEKYQFLRVNYPGGDMVGHFGEMQPTVVALEAIDLALAQIITKVNQLDGITLITADHGNAEELLDETGQPKTAHTTNPVPCIFVDNTANAARYELADGDFGLANLASTIAILLGQTPDEHWLPGIIRPNSIN